MYKVCQLVEMVGRVPLGMSNLVPTLPEAPTIGFAGGRTSSIISYQLPYHLHTDEVNPRWFLSKSMVSFDVG